MILKMPWCINPCRKCIVRAMCTMVCPLYGKRVNQTQQFSKVLTWALIPFNFPIELYKDKDWWLFGIIAFSYIACSIEVGFFIWFIIHSML